MTKEILNIDESKHKFYFGSGLPAHLDEIGQDFDFVILDTAHYLPGELLDFPVLIKILKEDAVVCLHDIVCHQAYGDSMKYATAVLFSTVTAEKFLNFIPNDKGLSLWCFPRIYNFSYPNIGAFKINKYTLENIMDIFCALIMRWDYMPPKIELNRYTEFIRNNYDENAFKVYNEAIKCNSYNINIEDKYQILKFIPQNSNVLIFSTNIEIYQYIQNHQLNIRIIPVSNNLNLKEIDYIIILNNNKSAMIEICSQIVESGFNREKIITISMN